MKINQWLMGLVAVPVLMASAADPEGTEFQHFPDGCTFSPVGDNPYFPLRPGHRIRLAGEVEGVFLEVEWEVLAETKSFTLGLEIGTVEQTFETAVVRETEYEDGELVEISWNYYGHCVETGSVFYFGENVDDYENGEVVGHGGAWLVGEDGNLPGVIMPGQVKVGDSYFQEFAPGVAEDLAYHTITGATWTGGDTVWRDVIEVEELDGLDPFDGPSVKRYAPGVGLVYDDGIEVIEFERGLDAQFVYRDCSFVPRSDHPYFPLRPGHQLLLQGEEDGENVEVIWEVLNDPKALSFVLDGRRWEIDVAVVRETESTDGELTEISHNYFAQCLETGSVFYFGEDVDDYEEGEIVGHGGAWLAGQGGSRPGVIMPGQFVVGDEYPQEIAPGVAEDTAINVASGLAVDTPFARFEQVLRIEEFNPLEPDSEPSVKLYAPGRGLVFDDGLELVDVSVVAPPRLAIQQAIRLSWPEAEGVFVLEAAALPDGPWLPVAGRLWDIEGGKETFVLADSAHRFFRLRQP